MDKLNHLCFCANAMLQLCCKNIFQLLIQRKSSVLSKKICFDKAVETYGEILGFCIFDVRHKTSFFYKNSAANLWWPEPQIELITWHVWSPGPKHYRYFNSVLCNEHQHRRRGNQFQHNCPEMSFLAAIIPQSVHTDSTGACSLLQDERLLQLIFAVCRRPIFIHFNDMNSSDFITAAGWIRIVFVHYRSTRWCCWCSVWV